MTELKEKSSKNKKKRVNENRYDEEGWRAHICGPIVLNLYESERKMTFKLK